MKAKIKKGRKKQQRKQRKKKKMKNGRKQKKTEGKRRKDRGKRRKKISTGRKKEDGKTGKETDIASGRKTGVKNGKIGVREAIRRNKSESLERQGKKSTEAVKVGKVKRKTSTEHYTEATRKNTHTQAGRIIRMRHPPTPKRSFTKQRNFYN